MSPNIESTVNKFIKNFHPIVDAFANTVEWRDQESNVARKVVAGAGLAVLGLGCLIDAIVSLSLAILTSPTYLMGNSITKNLLSRSFYIGLFGLYSLTVAEYDNIVVKNLETSFDSRFS